MKKRLDNLLFSNLTRMRFINQNYVYFIHLLQSFLNFMPPLVRNLCFRLMLRRAGRHTYFDYDVYIKFPWLVDIGENVSINRGVQFYSSFKGSYRIRLGNDVYVAPNVAFYAGGHDLTDLSQITGGEIVVGNGVWIGAGAIILPGVTINDHCVVGAGSVVTRDVPPNTVVAGNPAREIRTRL